MTRTPSFLAMSLLVLASCSLDWSCDAGDAREAEPAPNLGSDELPCNEGNPTFTLWRGGGGSRADVSVRLDPTDHCRFKLIGWRDGQALEGVEENDALTETWKNVERLDLACLGDEKELRECCRYRIVAIE